MYLENSDMFIHIWVPLTQCSGSSEKKTGNDALLFFKITVSVFKVELFQSMMSNTLAITKIAEKTFQYIVAGGGVSLSAHIPITYWKKKLRPSVPHR